MHLQEGLFGVKGLGFWGLRIRNNQDIEFMVSGFRLVGFQAWGWRVQGVKVLDLSD